MFLGVELVPEAKGAEVEGATGLLSGSGALRPVMETPTGCAAVDRAPEVCEEIGGGRLPIGVAATKGLLIEERCQFIELSHGFETGPGLSFGLSG